MIRNYTRTASIAEGITLIGTSAFSYTYRLVSISIPSSVQQICDNAFRNSNISSINIPASVKVIGEGVFENTTSLESITVDSANTAYTSVDGILYSKDMKTLIAYPAKKNVSDLSLPESVESIAASAFSESYQYPIKNFNISKNLTEIGSLPYVYTLESITVDAENPEYTSVDGVLFSKDKTVLLKCPLAKAETYTVPDFVTEIGEYGFSDDYTQRSSKLKTITIPKTVKKIADTAMGKYNYFTIRFNNGSVAELYVKAKGLTCECIEGEDTVVVFAEGTCGENGSNAVWKLYDDGEMVISGTGATEDYYQWNEERPFSEYISLVNKLTVEEGITRIGDSFFGSQNYSYNNCPPLAEVSFPASLEEIGTYAFQNCSNIKTVTFSEGLVKIEDGAFQNCQIKELTLPSTLLSIGNEAFSLNRIESLQLPANLLNIGERAFYSNALTTVAIPKNVNSIGSAAFAGNDLTGITVDSENPNFVSENGVLFDAAKTYLYAYPQNGTAETYSIPEGVQTVDDYAFYSINNIKEVTVPASVTYLGTDNFYSCDSLEKVTMNTKIAEIGSYVFRYCDKLTVWIWNASTAELYVKTNNIPYEMFDEDLADTIASGSCGASLTWTLDSDGKLVISGTGDMYNWEWGDQRPWENYESNIKSVVISENVTSIGNRAFYSCDNLASVTFSEGLVVIGGSAFGFSGITELTFPDSLTTIGSEAFYYTDLTSLNITKGITSIASNAFQSCNSLTEITVDEANTSFAVADG
ncbi:MAG: leucine-rich repeat protein, partial [Clostridia bacterium]|nr:leucine-rich repeat protein [Clostridia bacterium]